MGAFSYLGIFSLCVTLVFSAPVQNDNLSELQEQLTSLQDVLQQLHDDIGAIEDKRSLETRSEQTLTDFESSLSADDTALLQKMQSKVKYLQTSLTETHIPDPDEVEKQSTERRGVDPQIKALFRKLSAQDQKLLAAHPSAAAALQKAYDDMAHAAAEEKREQAQDESESGSVLDQLKNKFDSLKDAMTHHKGDHSERSQDEINELKANLIAEVSNAKNNGYNQNDILKAISERKARDVDSELNDDDQLHRLMM